MTKRKWTIGFSKRIVTPTDYEVTEYYSAGYAGGCRCTSVLDDMYVRSVWLEDGSGRGGISLSVIDCVGLSNSDVKTIRKKLSDFIREANCSEINIACTHCHSAADTQGLWGKLPKTGRVPEYMEHLFENVIKCITEAYENRKTGRLFFGDIKTDGLLCDTRAPQVFDDKLTKITFKPDDKSAPLSIIHFAVHPEVLGGNNPLISADFPCYMGRKIEKETGGEFMYFTGAIGGLITCPGLDDIFEKRVDNVKTCIAYGEKAADFALAIDNEREISPGFIYKNNKIEIPVSNIKFVLAKKFGLVNNEVRKVKGKPYKYVVMSELAYLSLGGSVHVMLVPGELYSEIAMGGYLPSDYSATGTEMTGGTIFEMMPDGKKLIFGLCNDEVGYIIPENDFCVHKRLPYITNGVDRFGEEHYEETNSIGVYAARTILNESKKLLSKEV